MPLKPELLAPAGAWESLVAAVENGADAVYLGGKLYNARESAGNFDAQELRQAVDFAHLRGVKVYVTVNTLLAEHELAEAVKFLYFLQNTGADAAIVQDMGLIHLAGRVLPEFPLHASTQMTVHNLATAQLLQEKGIDRIVLARELSLADIQELITQGAVAAEVFVHGALCICYSGQCLLSSMIGGRSGNRGRCAQPCRLKYALVDEKGRALVDPTELGEHLLSPRDLNLSRHLPDLCRAGITSLKIEGRMKRPEYVATVVRIYRALLDRAAAVDYQVSPTEAGELAQIFNRDFTSGYLYGRPGRELMNYKRPNNRGVRLGRVKSFNKSSKLTALLLELPLRVGDGIEVWVSEGGRAAGKVHQIVKDGKNVVRAAAGDVVHLAMPGRVFPGDRVFKTHDADLMEQARSSFSSAKEQKNIPLDFAVWAAIDEPLRLRVTDPEGRKGEAQTNSPGQQALKHPLTPDYLRRQLGRLGNTPFNIAQLRCELQGEVMVPVAEINEARRLALTELAERRWAAARSKPVPEEEFQRRFAASFPEEESTPMPIITAKPELSIQLTAATSLAAALESGVDRIYFGGEQYRSQEPLTPELIQAAAEKCRQKEVQFVLSAPRIMQNKEMSDFRRLLRSLSADFLDGIQVSNLGLIKELKELTDKPIYPDFSLNVFNWAAAVFLWETGAAQVTLSPELTTQQIQEICYFAPALPLSVEVLVHGAIPLLVSEHCVVGSLLSCGKRCAGACAGRYFGLKDRKGIVFPLEMDCFGRMHLFNSRDLCMIGDLDWLIDFGVTSLRIEARRGGADYVRDVVRAYRLVLDEFPETLPEDSLAETKGTLAKHSPDGFTRGHYYRGVL